MYQLEPLKAAKQYASFFLPKLGFGHGIGVPSRGRKIKGEGALEKDSNLEQRWLVCVCVCVVSVGLGRWGKIGRASTGPLAGRLFGIPFI